LGIRLLFARSLGLGIDESYMVAAGRRWQLSYFDHPPLAWWLAWAAAHLAGDEAAIVVRLPFIALFAMTTGLMYRLTAALWGAAAGLWAAVVLNLVPVLSVTAGSWVLPDGPLFAALLGAAFCLVKALPAPAEERARWGWWLAAGACAGLALLSKYSAVLTLFGAFVFLLTEPGGRRWLRRPQPWVAALVATLVFTPVLVWNARHGWISLRFQGARAVRDFHPLGPLLTTAGAALYVLPWIWLALLLCGWHALRRGPRDEGRWLFLCLAAPPIVFFTIVSLWSHVLFHWAAPGYLMLVPLLGEAIARRRGRRRWLAATAVIVLTGMALVASEVQLGWLPPIGGRDPALAGVDWISLRADLARRGLLDRPGLVVAATRWLDAGKIDYALGGRVPVVCLGDDPREYGLTAPVARYAGRDVLIVAPRVTPAEINAGYGALFDAIETLPPASVLHDGRPALSLPLYLGRRLH
jgi:4-amino-4-deoxy-L-arabinose transferase-like glycosyltransferase